jgi:hypothetical protein
MDSLVQRKAHLEARRLQHLTLAFVSGGLSLVTFILVSRRLASNEAAGRFSSGTIQLNADEAAVAIE